MKTGFSFKGVHSDSFGVTVKTDNRPIIPAVKTKTASAAYMDGEYDFSTANPYGRLLYENRAFTVMLQISGENLADLNFKLSKIATWLTGSGKLIFDDMDAVYWAARIYKEIAYAPERHGKKALITAEFTVEPFSNLRFDSLHDIVLGDNIRIGSNIPLDGVSRYFTHGYNLIATGDYTWWNAELKIPNMGQRPIRPVITITFSVDETINTVAVVTPFGTAGSSLTVSNGTSTITAYNARTSTDGGTLVIDFETQEVIQGGSALVVTGEFFEFDGSAPSVNLSFYGTIFDLNKGAPGQADDGATAPVDITVAYTPQYMWDADFDGTDWGI